MRKQSNVPQLRFKGFDGQWENCLLSDATKYTKGFAFKSDDYQNNGVRIVRVSDLSSDSIKNDIEKVYIDELNAKLYDKYRLRKGNIIITTVGSKPEMIESAVGRGIFINNENEGLLNQNMLKFENIKNVDNRFIIGLINTKRYQHYMKSIARGNANQANITVVDLLQFEISIPILPEQEKIASFLSAVDEKIQQLTRKAALLEQYKKGVMQQLFSGKLRFKDENGEEYADWEEKKLGEVAEKRIVKNKDNKINLVFTNSAMQGIVNQRDFFDKDIANQNNLLGYYIVDKNDFVYNPRISTHAPVGPISRNHLDTGIMSPLYSVFRFKNGNLDFIEYFFNSTVWHLHMKDISNYGARDDRMSFSTNDFYKMPIPFPSIEEQQKIAGFLSGIDKKIGVIQSELKKMQGFKKGLLQQMFV